MGGTKFGSSWVRLINMPIKDLTVGRQVIQRVAETLMLMMKYGLGTGCWCAAGVCVGLPSEIVLQE